MTEAKEWLFLRIQKRQDSEIDPKNVGAIHELPLLFVSIPKKTVRLATERNRLKRLIREAFRTQQRLDPSKSYTFRVMNKPGDIGLSEAKNVMDRLIKS